MKNAASTPSHLHEQPVRVLLFEDNPGDAFLFGELVSAANTPFVTQHVSTMADGLTILASSTYDVVLVDLSLPDSQGLQTFEKVYEATNEPIIVLTGSADSSLALEAVRKGAQDYLSKNGLTSDLLERAICYAIERQSSARLKEEVRLSREQVAAVEQTRRRFISNVSHELRTPLTAINGYLQLLEQDTNLAAPQRNTVSQALKSGNHLQKLITEILEISKAESQELTLTVMEFDPEATFETLINRYRKKAEAKDLVFHYEPSNTGNIHADQPKLQYAVSALLDNAIKFTAEGCVSLSITKTERFVTVAVTDTGPGINVEDRESLFEPLQRDLDYLSNHGTSVGLGLPLSKAYVELMDGALEVVSVINTGSTFTIRLPVLQQETTSLDINTLGETLTSLEESVKQEMRSAIVRADPDEFDQILKHRIQSEEAVTALQLLMRSFRYKELVSLLDAS